MTQNIVMPTGMERILGPGEVIISETDTKGLITGVNEVFMRMAAYNEYDLIGRPHNLIRHPDMPRCVFKLLWDTIGSGREIYAYVVNLAGDGAHYWVFAHVFPLLAANGTVVGYRSERRTPSRSAIETVAPLYRQLRDIELSAGSSSAGLEASTAHLTSLLAGLNQTYDQFVLSIV